jgi:hypothetical protein
VTTFGAVDCDEKLEQKAGAAARFMASFLWLEMKLKTFGTLVRARGLHHSKKAFVHHRVQERGPI